MVAGAQQQPQPHQQQQPASAEEEAVKRSTDCVYFLASPLTCKKGSECEYRHSDFARVNPRDCWYWLNSNCLNPKCAFRHPPIEGLLGTQASSSAGFTPSLSQATVAPVTSATQNSSKQVTSCIYFQKGYCMKGDRCSFLHGPNPPTSAKVAQASAAPQGSDSSNVKKVFPSLQKCSQEQKIPQENTAKSVGAPPMVNPVTKVELAPLGNGVGFERSVLPTKPFDDEHLRTKAVSVHVMNGMPTNQINRSHPVILSSDHVFQNGKDADEFLRESSPGFDVLVEDELGDQEYFHGEDQYGRLRARDGRSLNVDEYDMDRSADYGSAADVDRDRFCDPRGFESHVQGQYAWEPPRALSDRKAIGAPQFDGRGYRKSNSPDNIDGTDLRHQLSKHRRVNGLQSVMSHDYAHDGHNDDRNYRGSSRRDSQPIQQHKGPLSSRLRGRINFGSSTNGAESRVDREFDRGRSRGRLSPNKSQTSTYQGRFRDRLKGGVHDSYNNEGRSGGSSRTGRDITDDGSIKFSGPKSLPELKGGKGGENKEQSILGKRKNTRTEVSQQPEGDVSFDGPKPLSEILKRKRKAEAVAASERGKSLVESQSTRSTTLDKEEGESKSASIDVVGTKDKIEDPQGVSNEAPNNANELEAEEGMICDETVDDQELEADDDQAHGEEYDYEQGEEEEDEEGEYDVENAEGEEEYLEDEDDDFAKKIGVLTKAVS